MKFIRPSLLSIVLLVFVAVGAIFFLPHVHKAKASGPTTWYIRLDGGNSTECTGTTNAPYSGSGTNQPCAFNHPFWLLTPWTGTWIISPGDTIQFEDQGPYYIGEQNNGVGTDWHSQLGAICPGPSSGSAAGASCTLPPIPDNVTILGDNVGNCHNSNHTGLVNPTVLVGIDGTYAVFNVQGSNHVSISCFQVTQPDVCVGGGSSPVVGACNHTSNFVYKAGIVFETGSTAQGPSNLNLQDIAVVGLAGSGIAGSHINTLSSDVTAASDIYLIGNGASGWDSDGGGCTTGCESVGTVNLSHLDIEWNGCNAIKPYTTTIGGNGFTDCYGQNDGGYGDGFVQVAAGNMTLNVTHSVFKYNTQDGFDSLHLSDDPTTFPSINISDSWSEGNAGQEFKLGAGTAATAINNVAIGNCSILEDPSAFAAYNNPPGWIPLDAADTCRASGDLWSFQLDNATHITLENNTTLGYNTTMYDVGCAYLTPNCLNASTFIYKNNLNMGYPAPANAGRLASGFYFGNGGCPGPAGTCLFANPGSAIDHNLWYNMDTGCPDYTVGLETSYICGDPLIVGESDVNNLNPQLTASSPAIGAGIAIAGLTTDYSGATRNNPPSIGAFEGPGGGSGGSGAPSDTTPPTVSITSPTNNSTVSSTLSITASATDNVGVTGVQLYVDGVLKSTDTSSPYSFSLDTTALSNGSHTIILKASDAAANIGTSPTITITVSNTVADTTPPSVPTNLAAANITSSSVSLSWTASTDNIGVTGYNIYRGGVKIGTSNSTSFTNSGLVASTSYVYTVAAFDAAGNTSAQSVSVAIATNAATVVNPIGPSGYTFCANESGVCSFSGTMKVAFGAGSNFTILTLTNGTPCTNAVFGDPALGVVKACFTQAIATDTTPPTTSITAPAVNATISGTFSVTALASDNIGVVSVALYVDGLLKGTDNSSPYTFSLDTSALSNGTHTLYTKAFDAAGNVGTAGSVAITVSNNAVITPPVTGGSGGGGGAGAIVSTPTTSAFEITSVSVTNITTNSANITIVTHAAASVTVKYGRTTSYGSATQASPFLTTNYENLANLSPGTAYDFVVVATLSGGTSVVSQPYLFVTAQATTTAGIVPVTVTAAPPAFTQSLAYGDTGPQVTLLQTILHNQGFLPATLAITDYFGTGTEHALLLFQNAHDLNRSGFVDLQSEALLNKIAAASATVTSTPVSTSTSISSASATPVASGSLTRNLAPGSTGADVTVLQHILAMDGDYSAGIFSTYYGSLTEAAVRIMQAKYGIINYGLPTTTGYGAVGPKTRAKVNSL